MASRQKPLNHPAKSHQPRGRHHIKRSAENMNRKLAILIACQLLAPVAQLGGSEMTASLAGKVEVSDLVAIVRIAEVERGKVHQPEDWDSDAQDFTMRAKVLDRIKGRSPDNITIFAYSTSYAIKDQLGFGSGSVFSTAGFSAYGIEPGKSYIAYLREDGKGRYKLGRNSNQYLEVISLDGEMVNDIGQVMDQVPLEPKLRTLRALAAEGRLLALIAHPLALLIALSLSLLVGVAFIRKKRFGTRKQPE